MRRSRGRSRTQRRRRASGAARVRCAGRGHTGGGQQGLAPGPAAGGGGRGLDRAGGGGGGEAQSCRITTAPWARDGDPSPIRPRPCALGPQQPRRAQAGGGWTRMWKDGAGAPPRPQDFYLLKSVAPGSAVGLSSPGPLAALRVRSGSGLGRDSGPWPGPGPSPETWMLTKSDEARLLGVGRRRGRVPPQGLH